MKTSDKLKRVGLSAAALAFTLALCPMFASAQGQRSSGVMDENGTGGAGGEMPYVQQTWDSESGQWVFNDDGKDLSTDSNGDGASNSADYGSEGNVRIVYDTTQGVWFDPGNDPEEPGQNDPDGDGPLEPGQDTDMSHPAGTFQVVIPTLISYSGMSPGKVSTSDDYDVVVRGAIPQDKTVTLTAQSGQSVSCGSDSFQEVTTQGKTTWSSAEAYGSLNADGSLEGTHTTDNISLSGQAKSSGTYIGSVVYTASMS